MRTAPLLQSGKHQLHLLRLRGTAAALRHVDEHIRVYHQEIYLLLLLPHLALGKFRDVFAVGQTALGVEVHHVAHQEFQGVAVHQARLLGRFVAVHRLRVLHAQGYARYLPHVLALDRLLEREEGHALVAVVHQMRHHAVQEIRLSRVRAPRQDDEPAIRSGVEDAVGELAHAHLVAVVVVAHQDVEHLVGILLQVVHVALVRRLGLADDSRHLVPAERLVHLADVFLAAGQARHLGTGGILVDERLDEHSSRTVGVAAYHDVLSLQNPFLKGLVALGDVGGGAVCHAQHVGESAAHQGEAVFFALGDDDLSDDSGFGAQVVDAVDAVGGAGLGGRNLGESLAPFAGDGVLLHAAELGVDDFSEQSVAVYDGRHFLHALGVLALGVVGGLHDEGAHHALLSDDVGR